jgi:hypothetical protein
LVLAAIFQAAGDILMFLTGQSEIEKACHKINEAVAALPPDSCQDLLVLPIYAAMPPELQVGHRVNLPSMICVILLLTEQQELPSEVMVSFAVDYEYVCL